MSREEMREKVARAMRRLDETSSTANDVTWHDLADAAIALIRPETLEDAAMVALEEYRKSSSGEEIAAAIRALGAACAAVKEGK